MSIIDFKRLYSDTKRSLLTTTSKSKFDQDGHVDSAADDEDSPVRSIAAASSISDNLPYQVVNIIDLIKDDRTLQHEEQFGRVTDRFPIPELLDWAKLGVGSVKSLYFLPNYISEEEESDLISEVREDGWADLASDLLPHTKSVSLDIFLSRRDIMEGIARPARVELRFVLSMQCQLCAASLFVLIAIIFGFPGGKPLSSGMEQEALPRWLVKISEQLHQDGILPLVPNHVLINEYAPGQGIMPHKVRFYVSKRR
jgi:hypothetical protein